MRDPIQITEVKGRAQGGYSSAPFRCRGEDGLDYYVKLGNTHPSGLITEWIGGHLAKAMGLPIADFNLVYVDPDLTETLPADFKELRSGIGFGSLCAPIGHRELVFSDISLLDAELLAEVLIFDYWIANEDRKLGTAHGNPNALWLPRRDPNLLLIDHDNAFDSSFGLETFFNDHLARDEKSAWMNRERRENWQLMALPAIESLSSLWATIPEEWLTNEFDEPLPVPSMKIIENFLIRPIVAEEDFWQPFVEL